VHAVVSKEEGTMKLVIDRSRWRRGEGTMGSSLLGADGKMCCLGFYCKAVGKADGEIRGVAYPDSVGVGGWLDKDYGLSEIPEEHLDGHPVLGKPPTRRVAQMMAAVNDTVWLTPEAREAWLAAAFKRLGDVDVEFVDGEEGR
jgi:hypothetical protein